MFHLNCSLLSINVQSEKFGNETLNFFPLTVRVYKQGSLSVI